VRGGLEGVAVISTEQADARYLGGEADAHLRLGSTELAAVVSYVDAQLTAAGSYVPRYVPRIPPLNGEVRWEIPLGPLRTAARVRWAARMNRLHPGERATEGYAAADLSLSWLAVSAAASHSLAFAVRNLTDAAYAHHTSVIKDIALMPGREFRLSWSVLLE